MDLKGKKIVVMGLGLHGGGIAAAWWLFTQGARVIVTDLKCENELHNSLSKLTILCAEYAQTHSKDSLGTLDYVLGQHRDDNFASADMVIQNPAVPRESRYLEIARANGARIENEVSLFFLAAPRTPKAGITGTRGKSTTASLLHAMVVTRDSKAVLTSVALPSGSAGPCATLPLVLDAERSGITVFAIMELSSWQLECLTHNHMSPSLAVMTNIYPDHLNRYDSMDEYVEAKKAIYRYQKPHEPCIFNYDNEWTRRCAQEKGDKGRYFFSRLTDHGEKGSFCAPSRLEKGVPAFWMRYDDGSLSEVALVSDLALNGDHNCENALSAMAAALLWGVNPQAIRSVFQSFRGIPGRLEWRATVKGRDFYNDTAATSPQGLLAALQTLSHLKRRIVLIAGGSDKGLDFTPLQGMFGVIGQCILFEGTAFEKLETVLRTSYGGQIDRAVSMKEALTYAWQASREGDIILLSPGAASYGLFINEFDRGQQFEEGIEDLKKQQ